MAFCFSLFAHKLQSPDRYLREMKAIGSKLFNWEKELLCETDISEKPLPSASTLAPPSLLSHTLGRMCWVEQCCTTHSCRSGKAISILVGFQRNTFSWANPGVCSCLERALVVLKARGPIQVIQALRVWVHSRADPRTRLGPRVWGHPSAISTESQTDLNSRESL